MVSYLAGRLGTWILAGSHQEQNAYKGKNDTLSRRPHILIYPIHGILLSPALLVAVGKDRSGTRPAPVPNVFSASTQGALNVSTEDVYLLTNLNKKFDFPN